MFRYYACIKLTHVSCVVLSGSLFFLRGVLMVSGKAAANHPMLARLSYFIDSALLAAAIMLTFIIHQYPFAQAWLTAKVLLLPVYVILGIFALRSGKTRWSRAGFFAAALAVFGFIISVAVMHSPRGLFGT